MKTVAKIVGIGPRREGIGKTSGRPYDFVNVAIAYKNPGYDGLCAATVAVNTPEFLECEMKVGQERTVFLDGFDGRVRFNGMV